MEARRRSAQTRGRRQHSLVQIVERVGDAHRHLHSGLGCQLLDGCIALLPKRLRVILVGQTRNIPFLENKGGVCPMRLEANLWPCGCRGRYLEQPGKDIGGLAPNHKQPGVELPQAGVQILKTLQ